MSTGRVVHHPDCRAKQLVTFGNGTYIRRAWRSIPDLCATPPPCATPPLDIGSAQNSSTQDMRYLILILYYDITQLTLGEPKPSGGWAGKRSARWPNRPRAAAKRDTQYSATHRTDLYGAPPLPDVPPAGSCAESVLSLRSRTDTPNARAWSFYVRKGHRAGVREGSTVTARLGVHWSCGPPSRLSGQAACHVWEWYIHKACMAVDPGPLCDSAAVRHPPTGYWICSELKHPGYEISYSDIVL